MAILRIRIACWILYATNKHLDYVTLTVLPLQRCLQESFSMSRYTYIACLITISL